MANRPDTPGDPAPPRAGVRRAARAGVVALLGLCGPWACAPDPRLSVAGASLVESTPEADVVRVRLLAMNPGSGQLRLDSVRYAASAAQAGAGSASVRRSPEASVQGGAEQPFEVPVVMPPGTAGPGALITLRGRLTYKTEGTIPRLLFDWGLYRPSVGFEIPVTVTRGDEPPEPSDIESAAARPRP